MAPRNLKATRSPFWCEIHGRTRFLRKFYGTSHKLDIMNTLAIPLTVSPSHYPVVVKNRNILCKISVWWRGINRKYWSSGSSKHEILHAWSGPTNTCLSLTAKNHCKLTGRLQSTNVSDITKVSCNKTTQLTRDRTKCQQSNLNWRAHGQNKEKRANIAGNRGWPEPFGKE